MKGRLALFLMASVFVAGPLVPVSFAAQADVFAAFAAQTPELPAAAEERMPGFGAKRALYLRVFLILSLLGFFLLILTALFLLWKAKQLVESATQPNLPALERLVAKTRTRHPELSDIQLAKKFIHRQALRSGWVGLVTGFGGLPTLPITVPIDIAATIHIQSSLVHLLRLVRRREMGAEEISDASLWLITTGGQELTTASSKVVQQLLVKSLSKSLLKFLPILGGVVGFALNWASTQALGRLTLKWLERREEKSALGQATPELLPAEPLLAEDQLSAEDSDAPMSRPVETKELS